MNEKDNDNGLNLDQLEALARAADQGEGQHIYTNPRDSNRWERHDAWHRDASPAAVLELIALARRAVPVSAPIAVDRLTDERIGELYDEATSYALEDHDYAGVRAFVRSIERELVALANQPAPTAAPEQVAPRDVLELALHALKKSSELRALGFNELHASDCENGVDSTGCTVKDYAGVADEITALNLKARKAIRAALSQPSEAAPLDAIVAEIKAAIEDAGAGADIYMAALIAGKKVQALAAPSLPAAPAPLDADEMARLRRLLKALGHFGAFAESDEFVRGSLCTILGQAAERIEGMLPGPAAAPAAGDELQRFTEWTHLHGGLPLDEVDDSLMTDGGLALPTFKHGRTEIAWRAWHAAIRAHQPAQEQLK